MVYRFFPLFNKIKPLAGIVAPVDSRQSPVFPYTITQELRRVSTALL